MTITLAPLEFYARHGAALFPLPAGQKSPGGAHFWNVDNRAGSFKHDHSADPSQWAIWSAANPGCNFGVVAFASRWIIVDIDTSGGEQGRGEAWALWCELCHSWGLDAPLAPTVQSARGGWHVYLTLPDSIDAATLRQPDAVKGRINIRCRGFVVAAGSYYDGTAKGEESGAYALLSEAPLAPAPQALIDHCTPAERPTSTSATGTRDAGDVASLLKWLNERGEFADYSTWFQIGMALKIEFGDAGLDLWQLTHDETVDADTEATKWASFSGEAGAQSVTLNSFMQRAHQLGWSGTIRKSTESMFGNLGAVAQLAAAAGAQLPVPAGAVPMLAGQAVLADIGAPILSEFLAATADAPLRPSAPDFPTLPEPLSAHALFQPLRDVCARIVAMSEPSFQWKPSRVVHVAAVLMQVQPDICEAVGRRVEANGRTWPRSKIKLAAAAIEEQVQRHFVTNDEWIRDHKGEIESDNSDNWRVFLGIIGCEVRFNAWLERMEIRGDVWRDWTYIDDRIVSQLRTRGNRTKTRFRPSKEFTWDSLLSISCEATVDPALDHLDALAAAWDGVPRLHIWLSAACGVPCDLYHQAVSRDIIGGMVRRMREPGSKHDTMPVFFGFQGSSKSTMAAVIGDMGKSSLAEIIAAGTPWFTDTVRLGDETKELVLSLAGKAVVEIGEMGTRSNADANHIKAMVSRQIDEGRTAYARAVSARPRRNIFMGTTNSNEPLSDPTGNRRFLPVRVDTAINLAWLCANIGQLVGEAAVRHARGESFAIPYDVWGIAAEHQDAARELSSVELRFADWFAVTPATETAYITASDLDELCMLAGLRTGSRTDAMRKLGFAAVTAYLNGRKARVWYRGPATKPKHIESATRYVIGKNPQDGRAMVRLSLTGQAAPGGLLPAPRP